MKKRFLVIFSFVLVLSIVGDSAFAEDKSFDLEKTKKVLTELIQKALKERGVPSISIALVKGDEIVWKAAFGYSNVRTKTPATPDTIYCTGSTFKSVTATALMQLVEKGKFKLKHPVNRYLDESKVQDRLQSEKQVNFRHMLSHWSGLVPGAITMPIWGRELPKTLDGLTSALYSIRAPEKKWEYNNFAFGMAGLLIEKISDTEYEKYVVENILKPIGVKTPHPVYPSAEMVELMALPYMPGGSKGKPKPVAQVHFDVYPAGDIYLTAEDMARFLGAHLNGGIFNGKRILSEESVKEMHTAQFGGTYGFGFFIKKEKNGHTIISHGGGIPGQSSHMMGDVDARVGVYFMSNSGGPTSIAKAAINLLRGEEYIPPAKKKTISVDKKVLETYAGKYELMGEIILNITCEDQKLFVQVSDQPTTELLAETETKFFVKGTDYNIVFVKNEKGVVNHLVFGATGQSMKAERLK